MPVFSFVFKFLQYLPIARRVKVEFCSRPTGPLWLNLSCSSVPTPLAHPSYFQVNIFRAQACHALHCCLLPSMSTISVSSLPPTLNIEKNYFSTQFCLLWITFLDSTNKFDYACFLTSLYIVLSSTIAVTTVAVTTVLFFYQSVTFQWAVNSSIFTVGHIIDSDLMCGGDGDDERVDYTVHLNKDMPSILRGVGLGHRGEW